MVTYAHMLHCGCGRSDVSGNAWPWMFMHEGNYIIEADSQRVLKQSSAEAFAVHSNGTVSAVINRALEAVM